MTIQEASRRYKMNPRTIRALVRNGEIQGTVKNGKVESVDANSLIFHIKHQKIICRAEMNYSQPS